MLDQKIPKINKTASSSKSRKATTAQRLGKTQGRWTQQEHDRFIKAIDLYDKDWKKVTEFVGTRISAQVRSHAQKVLPDYKIADRFKCSDSNTSFEMPKGIKTPVSEQQASSPKSLRDSQSFTVLGKRKIATSDSPIYDKKRPKRDEEVPFSCISSTHSNELYPQQPKVNKDINQNYLQLQLQESVQTIQRPKNVLFNENRPLIEQIYPHATDDIILATKLERFIQRRLQLSEALYATHDSKLVEVKLAVTSLHSEVIGFLSSVTAYRQFKNPQNLKEVDRIFKRGSVLSLDLKGQLSSLNDIIETSNSITIKLANVAQQSNTGKNSFKDLLNVQQKTQLQSLLGDQSRQNQSQLFAKVGYSWQQQPAQRILYPVPQRAQPAIVESADSVNQIKDLKQILGQYLSQDVQGSGCSTGSTQVGGFVMPGLPTSRVATPQMSFHRSSFHSNK